MGVLAVYTEMLQRRIDEAGTRAGATLGCKQPSISIANGIRARDRLFLENCPNKLISIVLLRHVPSR